MKAGNTTADGLFTLEDVECIAACTEAPCLQVNYRYFTNVAPAELDQLVDDLRAGQMDEDIPPHGTLPRIRQHIPPERGRRPRPPRRRARSRRGWRPAPRGPDMAPLASTDRRSSPAALEHVRRPHPRPLRGAPVATKA